jgi:hypothetical protein
MPAELLHHGSAQGTVIHNANKGRPQLCVGNILHHVPGNAAVDVFYPTYIASGGKIVVLREALDIHECCADDYDTHIVYPLSVFGNCGIFLNYTTKKRKAIVRFLILFDRN